MSMNRRTLLRGLVTGLAAGGVTPAAVAAPISPPPMPLPVKEDSDFPWTYECYEPPEVVYDEVTNAYAYLMKSETQLRIRYRGNLLIDSKMNMWGVQTLYDAKLVEKMQKVRTPWTIDHVHYLYMTDPYVKTAIHLVAAEAINQKHFKQWPHADRMLFRSDPIGCIVYDLVMRWTRKS